jgi:hypothetical protein
MKKLAAFYFFISILVSCGNTTENNNTAASVNVITDSSASKTSDNVKNDSTNTNKTPLLLDNLLKYNSEKELIAKFGKDVKHTKEWGAEGTEEFECSVLYPETKNQVQFNWNDQVKYSGLTSVEIYGESSDWKTKSGIALGTTLKELEKLNKKPFTFFGFDWDYGGSADWGDGVLSTTNIHVTLGMKGERTEEFNGLVGDVEIKSNSKLAQKANIIVYELILSKN